MSMQQNKEQMSSQLRAQHVSALLQHAQQECRIDINYLDDVKAQAMFETIAETLGGVVKALTDYQGKTEAVWQSAPKASQSHFSPPTVSDLRVDTDRAEPPPRLTQEMPHPPQ